MCLAALCVLLAAACSYDYRNRRIPNALIVWMAVFGLAWKSSGGGLSGGLSYLGQAVPVMAVLYPFFKIGGLGAGDVKLLGVTAGYLPAGKVLAFLMCSLLIAAMISVMKMWKKGSLRRRLAYLTGYLAEVMKNGSWHLYPEGGREKGGSGICLSGPVFVSILLYLGGVY